MAIARLNGGRGVEGPRGFSLHQGLPQGVRPILCPGKPHPVLMPRRLNSLTQHRSDWLHRDSSASPSHALRHRSERQVFEAVAPNTSAAGAKEPSPGAEARGKHEKGIEPRQGGTSIYRFTTTKESATLCPPL
jgi:hypothetical protein